MVANTPEWDEEDLELTFTLTEGGEEITVIYNGSRPSGLTEGSSILAEGKYSTDGIFRANQLILKCPSKYESIEME